MEKIKSIRIIIVKNQHEQTLIIYLHIKSLFINRIFTSISYFNKFLYFLPNDNQNTKRSLRFPLILSYSTSSMVNVTATISGRLKILIGIILFPSPLFTTIVVFSSSYIPDVYVGNNP